MLLRSFTKHTIFEKIKDIEALTTNRDDGYSTDRYTSLNLGLHVGDDKNSVIKNREKIANYLNINEDRFATARQVHGEDIIVIDESNIGLGFGNIDEALVCDGFITDIKNCVLAINIADCAGVLLASTCGNVISALHCGRAGCEKKLILKAIDMFEKIYKIKQDEILISISPSIKSCCYEISEELALYFKEYKNGITHKNNSYFLDIQTVLLEQLLSIGVPIQHIETIEICTCCEKEFFSYRRDKECGRMWSLIGKR